MKSEWRVSCNYLAEVSFTTYTGCGISMKSTTAATVSALMTGYYVRSSV